MCSVAALAGCIRQVPELAGSASAYDKALREFRPGSSIPRPDPKAKPPQPAVAGTYEYETTIDGQQGELTFVKTVTVKLPRPLEDGSFELTTYSEDEYNDSNYSVEIWHSQGVFTKSSSWPRNEYPDCTYSPPNRQTAFPLKVGKTWTASSKCSSDRPRLHSARYRVLREESIEVAGEKTETYVIESKWKIITEWEHIEGVSIEWYSSRYGLALKGEDSSTRRGHDQPKPKDPFKSRSSIKSTQPSLSGAA